ncbi:GldG family protein [Candidatus Dojkabacteria bacterium]|nr:GldG family protein [Candidatus Dojkabacteria bacterium]
MEITLKKPKVNSQSFFKFLIYIGSSTLSQMLVLFVVLIGINILSQSFFVRFDLTETKTYTLSDGTKSIISSLEDPVTITTYFSKNLPPDILPVTKDIKDILEEYVRFSNGKIILENKNPDDEDFKNKAKAAGVPEIRFSEFSSDKFEVATGFLGIGIKYKEQTEAIELITEVTNLEYETTSKIYKLSINEKPTVGFLTGHGEKSSFADYSGVTDLIEDQFKVESVSLSEGEPIDPDKINILVIASPTSPLSQRDLFEIDQYIMRGGKLVVLADLYSLDFQNPLLTKTDNNINELTKKYGAEFLESILLDESYLPIQSGFYQIAYPFWILTQNENLDTDNPVVNKLESIVFFWANPLKDITSEGQSFKPLVKTTDDAWVSIGESISIEPVKFSPGEQNQYVVAAVVEGKQTSAFKDQGVPSLDAIEIEDTEETREDKRTDETPRVDEIENTRIVLIGDSEFISNDFAGGSEQNSVFFTNLLEWLSGSEDLMSIRSKFIERRPLDVIDDTAKVFTKIANVVSVPILLITLGVAYNILRKKQRSLL